MGTFTAKMAWDGARAQKMESPAGHQATAFAISTLIRWAVPTPTPCKPASFMRKNWRRPCGGCLRDRR
jgi:hypothetical protein